MRLLLDMNLSADLCPALAEAGHETVHWSGVGDPGASDASIMEYARNHGFIVVSHDLDFSALLAATHIDGPSVIQIRTQDVLAPGFIELLSTTLRRFEMELATGALVVVDESRSRVRLLPIT
jgi:predicted nuclease of predicted toxin-antitoxin system